MTKFNINDINASDEGKMVVTSRGRPTDWVWTFAGPGHPKTIAANDRIARERLNESREQQQQRLNGKKVKIDSETPAEARAEQVQVVVERLLDWTEADINGEPYPFSEENATQLLLDPRKSGLLLQCLEYLGDEKSF